MIELFSRKTGSGLADFLDTNRETVRLLASPEFVEDLDRLLRETNEELDRSIWPRPLDESAFEYLESQQACAKEEVHYIVADAADEEKRISDLSSMYPNLRFLGLGRDVFPCIAARRVALAFRSGERVSMRLPKKMVVVCATPRSGSSLVCDVISSLGAGNVREHLRPHILGALKSRYSFDRQAALRRFIDVATRGEWLGTKVITHFFEEYAATGKGLEQLFKIAASADVYFIFIDRRDKVAQSVSRDLAIQRGIWHVTNDDLEKQILKAPECRFDFSRLLHTYFRFRKETAVLDILREIAGSRRLELTYEEDVNGANIDQLRSRISHFLEIEEAPSTKKAGATLRRKIPGRANELFAARFRARYQALFRCDP